MEFDKNLFKQYRKIRRLQGGGGINAYAYGAPASRAQVQPLALIDLPQVQTGMQMPGGGGAEGGEGGKIPKFEGLPSDVAFATRKYQQKEQLRASLTEEDMLTNSAKFRKYRQMEQDINSGELENELKHNQERFEDVEAQVAKNSASDAFVTTAEGRLVATDMETGKTLEITPEEYVQGKGKFRAMRTVDIMRQRAKNINTALNNRLLDNAESTYGLPYISEYLDSKISNLGDTSSKGAKKVLGEVSRMGTTYKGLIKEMGGSSNNAMQIKSAVETTWSMLTDSMRAQLMAQSIRDNPEINSTKELMVAAFTTVAKNFNRAASSSSESSYEENIPASEYAGRGSGSDKTGKMGPLQTSVLTGTGYFKNVAPEGSSVSVNMYTQPTPLNESGSFIKDKNTVLGKVGLENGVFLSTGESTNTDEQNTYMVDGTADIVMMPVKDGKPNLQMVDTLSKAINQENERRRKNEKKPMTLPEVKGFAGQFYGMDDVQMGVSYGVIGKEATNEEKDNREYLNESSADYSIFKKRLNDQGVEVSGDIPFIPSGFGLLDNVDKVFKDKVFVPIAKDNEDLILREMDGNQYDVNETATRVESYASPNFKARTVDDLL